MIIYNVTVKVETNIADQWLQWLLSEHIPAIMSTKSFTGYKVVRLLEIDDTEGPTYAIQYFASSLENYKHYIENYAPEMRKRSTDKWGNHFMAFRSVMEVVK